MNKNKSVTGNKNSKAEANAQENGLKQHWEKVYRKNDEKTLGWYQEKACPSLELLEKLNVDKNELVADIGSGSSTFIDNLLELGYNNILASDISESALNITRNRIGEKQSGNIKWIVDDLTKPSALKKIKDISIWHDRAVFHFLVKQNDRKTYFDLLNNLVSKDRYVILATFNLKSAEKCSGLPIERYDEKKLQEFLGNNFELVHHFNHEYTMPSGSLRHYVYTLFKKIK